ncbi:YlmC/YmxH family sporulation protein [Calorimonas adulescens]|jgi:sporulation protein, YlmC/YmxH family|uniref:YlmC/YmxH family sporulation protein n=1 Tax=Calorimonas adulescens TaxID=2606906 RepID=A0A5D8Q8X1_9THEO|nr:YlmC/YmxH family sporulation protein [Calorimonas adulescens]TZE80827.1 YlmC/YmxH family sporulation protein [Calorimonas adulescens]
MLLSEFGGKELVNLNDGSRLGLIEDADLLIDEETGKIDSFIIFENRLSFFVRNDRNGFRIPWDTIRKIGNDMVIVEIDNRKNF